ncbi:MAG: winged helix DNA-binding domain-containing protein [Bacteroidota bacterium]
MKPLIKNQIALHRLHNQQIALHSFHTPQQIVAHLGAVQAQDYEMAKWAIGARLHNSHNDLIEQALNTHTIFRTHILRPTWHLVAATDIKWMLALTAPHVLKLLNPSLKKVGFDEHILQRIIKIIQKVLAQKTALTRTEIITQLALQGIKTDELHASHIMMYAELKGIVCNGPKKDKQQTYLLLDELVTNDTSLNREESLGKLAKRYFVSHGPATLQDFIWWSGLGVKDARLGLESIKHELLYEKIEEQEYWFESLQTIPTKQKSQTYFLPAFDQYIIGYKDRTASLHPTHFSNVITNNGIFKPSIVRNGEVIGTWKRTIKKDQVLIEPTFFDTANQLNSKELNKATQLVETFLKAR